MKLASISVGVWHLEPRIAAAMPQRNTVTPVEEWKDAFVKPFLEKKVMEICYCNHLDGNTWMLFQTNYWFHHIYAFVSKFIFNECIKGMLSFIGNTAIQVIDWELKCKHALWNIQLLLHSHIFFNNIKKTTHEGYNLKLSA